jgi:hypothetical protein
MPAKTVDEKQRDALIRFDKQVLRLEDVLAEYIKLVNHQLVGLRKSSMDGLGYQALMSDPAIVRQLKELGAALNSATDSQIRLDKTAKERAEKMTPDEEEGVVQNWIRSRDHRTRGKFLHREVAWHNEAKTGLAAARELTPPEVEPDA